MFNLQENLTINGKAYKIVTDFKIWINFNKIMGTIQSQEGFFKLLDFLKTIGLEEISFNEINQAIDECIKFFVGGESKKTYANSSTSKNKIFDFEKDEPYIYTSFLKDYKIDLYEVDLHWHKFKYLLQGISEETQLSKIIMYRTVDISKLSKEQKRFYTKMKNIYSLEQQTQKRFKNAKEAEEFLKKEIRESLRRKEGGNE